LARRSKYANGRGGNPAARMLLIRQVHAYLTAFVAPTILFFAVTGAIQLFGLHEAHDGYKPPALLERLGRLHTDQVFALRANHGPASPDARPPGAAAESTSEPADTAPNDYRRGGLAEAGHHDDGDARSTGVAALKWLFLAAAVMLIGSTLLGLWMALTQNRHRIALLVIFIVGAAAPLAILAFL
jgi:hypothetical protein